MLNTRYRPYAQRHTRRRCSLPPPRVPPTISTVNRYRRVRLVQGFNYHLLSSKSTHTTNANTQKTAPKLFLIILSICPNDERAIAIFAFFRLRQLYSSRFDSRFDRFDSQRAINVRKACARCPPRAFAAHTTAAILLRIPPRRAGSESSCT